MLALVTVLLYQAWLRYGPQEYVQRIGRTALPVIIASALFGTLSHVALDALMQHDMSVALISPYTGIVDFDRPATNLAEYLCVAALLLSPFAWLVRRWIERLAASGVIPPLSSITVCQ